MLVAPLPLRRPRGLPTDVPLLANPPAFSPSRELTKAMRALGTDDIEEAWYEYHRRVDDFKRSPLGIRISIKAGWSTMEERASGISADEYAILDRAYWAWEDGLIDHAEIERSLRRQYAGALDGDVICGYCGGEFTTHEQMVSHTNFCSFKPVGSLGLEPWRNRD